MYKLSFESFSHFCSQTKNAAVNGTLSATAQPLNASTTSSASSTRTERPPTTTYKAFTTSYRSSTRGYVNYTMIRGNGERMSDAERLRLKDEFYATYDVMTGIRIAATLGSFFVLMVFLIVYKSRSHSTKALEVSIGLQLRIQYWWTQLMK